MRVQFNLLPDVKMAFIRARRLKRLVMLVSVIVGGSALGLVVVLFLIVNVWEKQTLKDLDRDIQASVTTLKNTPDINKVLTIQNQLASLPDLHEQKPVASRIFTFVTQVVPAKTTISKLSVNYGTNTLSITGAADKLETINKFVDTLKFTTYRATALGETTPKAFSSVVLETFSRTSTDATYKITLSFDPLIFNSSNADLTLAVPKIVTTRSETEQPGALFDLPKDTPVIQATPTPTPSSTPTPSPTVKGTR